MLKFVTHNKLQRLFNKKLLAVLCLLLPWSFGFAEGGDDGASVAKLQKEVLMERSKSKQKAREIERLSKENKELAEKEEASNTSSDGGSTGSTQSSGNGQGLPNEKSPELEQYQLSSKNNQSSTARLEVESPVNTNMSTADSGDEDSFESSKVQSKSTAASSIQDSAVSSAITADSQPENTSSAQQQNLELKSAQPSKESAEVLTEITNKLVDMEQALKSVEDTLKLERESFQQEREEYKGALEQTKAQYDQDMLRLNEQMATAQENAVHLQEGLDTKTQQLNQARSDIGNLKKDAMRSEQIRGQLNKILKESQDKSQAEAERLAKESQANKVALDKANADLQASQDRSVELTKQLETSKLESTQLASNLEETNKLLQTQQAESERLGKEAQQNKEAFEKANLDLQASQDRSIELTKQLETSELKSMELTKDLATTNDTLKAKTDEAERLAKESQKNQEDLDKANLAIQALKKQLSKPKQQRSDVEKFPKLDPKILEKLAKVEPAVLKKLSTVNKNDLERLAKVNADTLKKLSAVSKDDLEKLAKVEPAVLKKLSTVSKDDLERLAKVDADTLKKLSSLDKNILEKVAKFNPDELKKMAVMSQKDLKEAIKISQPEKEKPIVAEESRPSRFSNTGNTKGKRSQAIDRKQNGDDMPEETIVFELKERLTVLENENEKLRLHISRKDSFNSQVPTDGSEDPAIIKKNEKQTSLEHQERLSQKATKQKTQSRNQFAFGNKTSSLAKDSSKLQARPQLNTSKRVIEPITKEVEKHFSDIKSGDLTQQKGYR